MNDAREIYIDSGIHKYIDIVFGRTYFLELTHELKALATARLYRVVLAFKL